MSAFEQGTQVPSADTSVVFWTRVHFAGMTVSLSNAGDFDGGLAERLLPSRSVSFLTFDGDILNRRSSPIVWDASCIDPSVAPHLLTALRATSMAAAKDRRFRTSAAGDVSPVDGDGPYERKKLAGPHAARARNRLVRQGACHERKMFAQVSCGSFERGGIKAFRKAAPARLNGFCYRGADDLRQVRHQRRRHGLEFFLKSLRARAPSGYTRTPPAGLCTSCRSRSSS